ncbi:hypothetical protein [Actinomadura decatromicini]|uniref:Uncharacterized protein n=1 Tax=Actinomadura decatromicini TaxID=2604572 RepID=A0A5D3F6H0_9ACTN|nr:hypothetical protein [Actinomadura decatromicini]TYK43722.1 hypothetical protein FXF68_36860 [Actinomadura decatromicini]
MKRLLVVPIVAAALTLSMSACGGDSKDDAGGKVSPSGGGTITGNGGGTITGNGGGGGTGGSTKGGGGTNGGGGGSELTPAQREALGKVVACMRKKGYGMPEPTSPVVVPTDKNGKSDAQVNKDSAECAAQSQPSGG